MKIDGKTARVLASRSDRSRSALSTLQKNTYRILRTVLRQIMQDARHRASKNHLPLYFMQLTMRGGEGPADFNNNHHVRR